MTDWDEAPSILVFSDTEAGLSASSEIGLANDGRILAALPIEQAPDRLDSQVSVDIVIVDIADDHGPLLDDVFSRLEAGAEAGRFIAVVSVAPKLVDVAAARIGHRDIALIVGPDTFMMQRAVARGLKALSRQLRDADDDEALVRYYTTGLRRGDQALQSPRDEYDEPVDKPVECSTEAGVNQLSLYGPVVRFSIRARRLRTQCFGPGLFADPAWDILLDLAAAQIEGRSVAVSSLCIAAAVPATTALRWIKQLTEAGMLTRVADPGDGRRVFIELTERSSRLMASYYEGLGRGARG